LVILIASAIAAARPGSMAGAEAESGPRAFYVAPNGNDAWTGHLLAPNSEKTDGPFATITRARDAVRQLKATRGGLREPVKVFLRGGTYFLREPLVLTPEDSGTASSPITYAAYQDEAVVISGGRRITGWKPVTADGKKLWTAQIPEVREGRWYFRQLWVGYPRGGQCERRIRARDPNKGYRQVAAAPGAAAATPWDRGQADFPFHAGDLKAPSQGEEPEVVVMSRWVDSHLPITRVDEQQHRVTFGKRSVFRLEPGDRYYVENAREALDAPGEWYLDRKTGVLSYLPLPGEDREHAEVIAPVLTQVVRLEGRPEAGQFVEHVSFRSLTFSHTEWWFPAHVQTVPSELDIGGFSQAAVGVPGAIYGSGVRDCAFENCTVAHVGGYGIELARGCRQNRIAGSTIFDLGAGGIKIGETAIRSPEPDQTNSNTVSDCHIHDGGLIFHSAVGIWIGQSGDNRILRNHIHDFYYTGLSVGWTWGYEKSLAKGNVIEFNHVHHIGVRSNGDGPILSDMGGIYTLGVQPGTVIRGNVFHDIAGFRYGGWGIYLDEGSSDILVENNLVYRTTHGGFHQHYGRENIVRNNIFALGRDAQIQRTRPEPHSSFTFERNIVYWREGSLFAGDLSDFHFAFDHNLYWQEGGREIRFGNLSWDEWRAKGMDLHSLVADPLFVAPEQGDFHLKPGSPAFKLGFVPNEAAAGTTGPPQGG
jgi:parallel beta-helix repeat protein